MHRCCQEWEILIVGAGWRQISSLDKFQGFAQSSNTDVCINVILISKNWHMISSLYWKLVKQARCWIGRINPSGGSKRAKLAPSLSATVGSTPWARPFTPSCFSEAALWPKDQTLVLLGSFQAWMCVKLNVSSKFVKKNRLLSMKLSWEKLRW